MTNTQMATNRDMHFTSSRRAAREAQWCQGLGADSSRNVTPLLSRVRGGYGAGTVQGHPRLHGDREAAQERPRPRAPDPPLPGAGLELASRPACSPGDCSVGLCPFPLMGRSSGHVLCSHRPAVSRVCNRVCPATVGSVPGWSCYHLPLGCSAGCPHQPTPCACPRTEVTTGGWRAKRSPGWCAVRGTSWPAGGDGTQSRPV